MSITNKLAKVSLFALLAASGAEAQQIQGINLPAGLCNGCTLSNPIINNPVINGTITGTGLTNYLNSPPPIGNVTPNSGGFSSLHATGTQGVAPIVGAGALLLTDNTFSSKSGGSLIFGAGSANRNFAAIKGALINGADNTIGNIGFWSRINTTDADLTNIAFFTTNGILSISSGLANSLTLAGSATNPTIGTTTGNLALNASVSSAVTQGVNGTLGTILTDSSFTVGNGIYSSFIALAPQGNAWINKIFAQGGVSGSNPAIAAGGDDANVGITLQTQGTGGIFFITRTGANIQAAVLDNASGSNFPTLTSGASSGLISSNAGNMTYSAAASIIFQPGPSNSIFFNAPGGTVLSMGVGGADYANISGGASGVIYTTNAGTVMFGSAAGTTTLSDASITLSALTASSPLCLNASKIITNTCTGIIPSSNLSGTSASLGGSALLAGQCSTNTTTVTGASTSMVVVVDPVTDPGNGAYWDGFVSSSNTVTTKVCATVALTPTASVYNIRVIPVT